MIAAVALAPARRSEHRPADAVRVADDSRA